MVFADEAQANLPEDVQETIECLYTEIQFRPRQAIPELEGLRARYPDVPVLCNYRSAAYMAAGMLDEARVAIRENYEKSPVKPLSIDRLLGNR